MLFASYAMILMVGTSYTIVQSFKSNSVCLYVMVQSSMSNGRHLLYHGAEFYV